VKAYKLVRKLKSGRLSPLFINKTLSIELGKWYESENHPTKGFKERQGWHCTVKPLAPHLSKTDRVWVEVEIDEYSIFETSKHQGSIWLLANKIKFVRVL
jgi:hypothetical protein